jgi:hypothetical protein
VKPKPTKAHLAREIKFDLRLARISLCIDIVANTAIMLAPAPAYKMHSQRLTLTPSSGSSTGADRDTQQFRSSEVLFVVSSWIAGWGAGLVPAIHSLALCIVQARALLEAGSAGENEENENDTPAVVVDAHAGMGTGKLFGALAVLQATGQMILGVRPPFPIPTFLLTIEANVILFHSVAPAIRADIQRHGRDVPQGRVRHRHWDCVRGAHGDSARTESACSCA